jgi:hypothetical protein
MAIATTTMLAIAAVAAVAGAGYSMYAADTAAKQQESNLKFQSDQMAADAAAARGEAEVEALRIRKAAKAQRAQATAAAAASGIDVNSPTALKIDEEIVKNSEEDAYLTILGGKDRGARMGQQSYLDRQGASIARQNGRQQNTATLISTVGNVAGMYSDWKTAG